MQKQNSNHYFKSSDLSLVSAILSTQKAELVSVEPLTPYKFEFHLQPAYICYDLERLYINGKLMVSAKSIADNVRLLKSLIKQSSNTRSNTQYGNDTS